jgi:hypothetical protein
MMQKQKFAKNRFRMRLKMKANKKKLGKIKSIYYVYFLRSINFNLS